MTLDNERSAHLQAVADRLAAAVFIVGTDGRVVLWNRAAEALIATDGELAGQPIEQLLARVRTTPAGGLPQVETLTPRQREVLQLIAEGRPTRDIARELKLSVKTIETHRAHLMQRLRLDSVARLVRYAVSAGLVPPTP